MATRKRFAAFDRNFGIVDARAAQTLLANGIPVHVARGDTPDGFVIRILPDGREEEVSIDLFAAAKLLGE